MNNNLKPIETLRPFTRFLCTIGELPTSYLVSMTYEEQLIWFCNYLEKTVIPTINNNAEAVEELKNLVLELQHYLDNLDLQDEVDNKLDEMAEDGTLANLINQEILSTKMSAYKPTASDLKLEYSSVGNYQAFCHTVDGKFVIIKVGDNDNSNVLEEYNSEGTLLRSITFTAYHPNTVCYADGYLYIGNAYSTSEDVQTPSTIITKVNYSNLETSEINFSHTVGKIAYYDNKFYIVDGNDTLKIYNNDFSNLISTNSIPNYGDIYQGIAVNEHHIILTQSYSWIVFLNHDLTLDKIINIRNFDYITAGELQDIDYYDNKIYTITSRTLGHGNIYWFIGSFDYVNGNPNQYFIQNNVNPYTSNIVFADSDNTSIKQLGTQTNPFSTIEQCVFVALNPYITGLKISIYNGTYDKVHLSYIDKPLDISGREQKANTLVHSFNIEHCANVSINNMTLTNVYNPDGYNHSIHCVYSKLTLENIAFSNDNSLYFRYGELFTGYSISVTGSNSMDIANCVYSAQEGALTNFVKKRTTIFNEKAVLLNNSDGVSLTSDISFAPYNINDFKCLKITFKLTTTAGGGLTWYHTQVVNVSSQEKFPIFFKNVQNSLFWWTVITLNMNLSSNKISGSYQSTSTITGETVGSSSQPTVVITKIEEV